MRARSKKRAAQERQYKKAAELFLRAHMNCQCCQGRRAVQVHHKKGRIGELLTNDKYFMAVCAMCHQKIEIAPKWARDNGYSLSRLALD